MMYGVCAALLRHTIATCTGVQLPIVNAQMSTMYGNGDCSGQNCIDGDVTGNWIWGGCTFTGSKSMCHSKDLESDAWIRLDLATPQQVECVMIYNRDELDWAGSSSRLGTHQIWAGDDSSTPTLNTLCSESSASTYLQSIIKHDITQSCTGRYLFVYLPPDGSGGNRILNLYEVQLYSPIQSHMYIDTLRGYTCKASGSVYTDEGTGKTEGQCKALCDTTPGCIAWVLSQSSTPCVADTAATCRTYTKCTGVETSECSAVGFRATQVTPQWRVGC
eukprot:Hpha_TRINITY_DN16010_c4_g1::TRINITY_DN16010_c4_g1_i1::g.120464::m.120464